jgi:hypothetical protein
MTTYILLQEQQLEPMLLADGGTMMMKIEEANPKLAKDFFDCAGGKEPVSRGDEPKAAFLL